MNALDYLVLLGTMLGIAAYGMWQHARAPQSENLFERRRGTPAGSPSAFPSWPPRPAPSRFSPRPARAYESGLGFVQNYFGMPIALIIIAAVFLPIYRRLNVYTAYEFLGRRFDSKTRLLGAALFLLQRGLGAGITIYAPAIIVSTVFGWPLDLTIIFSGVLVIIYTVAGGSEAVAVTQKYQMAVIFAGMVIALCRAGGENAAMARLHRHAARWRADFENWTR